MPPIQNTKQAQKNDAPQQDLGNTRLYIQLWFVAVSGDAAVGLAALGLGVLALKRAGP
jgi:hypothetical protein